MCSAHASSTRFRQRRRARAALVLAGVFAVFCSSVTPAEGKVERTANWKFEVVWPALLRFLRIDEGHEILEKDSEAGYVIFRIKDEGKDYQGALEAVPIIQDRRPSVRLSLRIEDRPDYMASGILQRFLYKLQDEYGPPPPPPPPPEEKKPKEEGAE